MTHRIENRISETSTTVGTGPFALQAATGYPRFGDKLSIGDTCWYVAEGVTATGAQTGNYEFGVGTYSAANTLTRTQVIGSSNAGSIVNFPTGTKKITMGILAPDATTTPQWKSALNIISDADAQSAALFSLLTSMSAYFRTQTALLGARQ
jgi:hypothetical protein